MNEPVTEQLFPMELRSYLNTVCQIIDIYHKSIPDKLLISPL